MSAPRTAIVLGGSFNPPTLAHKALMEHARKHVGKRLNQDIEGIYVPSSRNYVTRKVMKLPQEMRLIFSEEERLEMLHTLAWESCSVSTVEYGDDGRGHSHKTMRAIHAADPDCTHMFLLGADKLHILPKWGNIGKFLSEFTFVVTSRDSDDAKALVDRIEPLLAHKDRFIFIPELSEEYASFSSTKARSAILTGNWDKVEELCGKDVTGLIYRMCRR